VEWCGRPWQEAAGQDPEIIDLLRSVYESLLHKFQAGPYACYEPL
jgi:hypothetical protein